MRVLSGAAVVGAALGVGSIAIGPDGWAGVSNTTMRAAVMIGAERARTPQRGDRWKGCNEARAAGTAPIYIGEPGYRREMDGEACEPYY